MLRRGHGVANGVVNSVLDSVTALAADEGPMVQRTLHRTFRRTLHRTFHRTFRRTLHRTFHRTPVRCRPWVRHGLGALPLAWAEKKKLRSGQIWRRQPHEWRTQKLRAYHSYGLHSYDLYSYGLI